MASERDEPTFRSLLLGNLRVVAWAMALMLVAYGMWRALAWLFPDIEWLQLR